MDEKDLIKTALEQANSAIEFEKDNREKAVEDSTFVFSEDQWDETVKNDRAGRPCLNANDLPVFLDKVTAAQRMNRAGIKAMPVDSNTDPEKAEIVGGLIRYIEHVSDAHVAYDMALEDAAARGYCGAIRVLTQYENEDVFDNEGNIKDEYRNVVDAFNQEIRISPVDNSLNVLFDPRARLWHKNDGKFMFLLDDIPVDQFKEDYPDAQVIDFEAEKLPENLKDWYSVHDKTVRIAEWFRKERKGTKKIYLIFNQEKEDYEVLKEKPAEGITILKEREIEDFDIVWRKISGTAVLEGPIRIPGKLWPIIPVWGKEANVNGKKLYRGLFRYAKDPQRMYIYTQSAITELLALQPKAPFIATPRMTEGFESQWRQANTDNSPVLYANPDEKMPGVFPRREVPPQIPSGLVEQGAQRQIEKKDIIGLHEASLGRKSNETSGLAIRERKAADDAVTFAYHDNLVRAIRQVGRVIESMRPEIYDTARVIKMLGIDGKTITTQDVNRTVEGENGEQKPKVDLTVGKHDIIMQTGPSYATQRQEALDRLQAIMQYAPQIAPLIADVLVDYMDIPRGEKLVKRLETLLPPEVREMEGGQPPLTQEMVARMIQDAVEEFKQSLEGQKEALKVEQQNLKVQQEELKLKEEQVRLAKEATALQGKVADMGGEGGSPIEGRQYGGPVNAGQPYIVGENGPEVIVPGQDGNVIPNHYGARSDGSPKGLGFLGELKRPDGKVSTEISIGVNLDGREIEIPSLVPTLTKQEVNHLLSGGQPNDVIVRKAMDYARYRIAKGKSPFAQQGEQINIQKLNAIAKGIEHLKDIDSMGLTDPEKDYLHSQVKYIATQEMEKQMRGRK